jgi:hypothetical protein
MYIYQDAQYSIMPEEDRDFTSIRLRKVTRDRLAAYGSKREDYDHIINRLLNVAKQESVMEDGNVKTLPIPT